MTHINVNFDDVPYEIETPPPGQYDLEVAEAPTMTESKKASGMNLNMVYRIVSEGKFKGRSLKDTIFQNEFGLIKTKQLALAAGLHLGKDGLNTEELIGKMVKVLVTNGDYTDPDTGEKRKVAKISKYIYK